MKDIVGMQIIIFAEAQQLAVERSHLDRNLLFFFFAPECIFFLDIAEHMLYL